MANKERYSSLDGARAYSAILIVLMHIHANSNYHTPLYDNLAVGPFLNNLTFFFMIISGFSLCCGYYQRQDISWSVFYKKRFTKIWPFFALLVLIDYLVSPSLNSLFEMFADLTLCFGLLPNANISVIGVGWFLGVVFVFYLIFPFFCFILENKKRAWLGLLLTILFNVICTIYFFDENHVINGFYARTNFIYCFMYFMMGGIIFLYREPIIRIGKKFRWFLLCGCVFMTIIYFGIPALGSKFVMPISMLVLYTMYLIYAISTEGFILNNKFVKFISSISLEVYLCHMFIFGILKKFMLNYILGNNWLSFVVTFFLVLLLSVGFSLGVKMCFRQCKKLSAKRNHI